MNKLDIGNKFNNLLDTVHNTNDMNSVDNYMNNYDLKVSLVNID